MLASRVDGTEGGFALIVVIWGIGIISLLMLGVITTARYRTVSARNAVENAKAEALAEAGIGLLRIALSTRAASGSLAADGLSDQAKAIVCSMPEGAVAALAVRDEGGTVDLNTAAPELIAALLAGLGADTAQSDKLAKNVADFSQRSRSETADSVVAREYAALGLKHGPKRAPFETIYELGQVPGFSRQLLRSVLPLVTVHSHSPGIDPKAADPVLLVLSRLCPQRRARRGCAAEQHSSCVFRRPVCHPVQEACASVAHPREMQWRLPACRRASLPDALVSGPWTDHLR
jgi:general secretion pathway protein K